jgi:hypothetical protein
MSSRATLAIVALLGLILICLAVGGAIFWVTNYYSTPPVTVAISTSIPTATPSAAVTPTSVPASQPTQTFTPTPGTSPTPTPTFTPAAQVLLETSSPTPIPVTDTPEPTPTPWQMALRDDLPPLVLSDWPLPAGDNGWGMHFLASQYYTPEDVDLQIARLKEMHIKWSLVIYGDENMLRIAAPRFRDAGIMVVWRRMLRASDRYYDWGRDISILAEYGLPPYMQIYNEPSLSVEWDEGSPDIDDFMPNFLHAAQDVYNAGGYVGLQFVREDWLVAALDGLKRHNGERVFQRMFFIPHAYGLNHPPEYDADVNAVLGFLPYAADFEREIGFVPPMITGEGGWAIGSDHDANYPKVTPELHRDYYIALFSMFRSGVMPNGDPLPDYFFAFCPWILSDPVDDTAFYDSYAGPRTLTIEAIKAIPPFERQFSWSR